VRAYSLFVKQRKQKQQKLFNAKARRREESQKQKAFIDKDEWNI